MSIDPASGRAGVSDELVTYRKDPSTTNGEGGKRLSTGCAGIDPGPVDDEAGWFPLCHQRQ